MPPGGEPYDIGFIGARSFETPAAMSQRAGDNDLVFHIVLLIRGQSLYWDDLLQYDTYKLTAIRTLRENCHSSMSARPWAGGAWFKTNWAAVIWGINPG